MASKLIMPGMDVKVEIRKSKSEINSRFYTLKKLNSKFNTNTKLESLNTKADLNIEPGTRNPEQILRRTKN